MLLTGEIMDYNTGISDKVIRQLAWKRINTLMIRITKIQWYVATQKQKETKTNEEVLAKITMRSTTIIAKTSKMIAELHKLHS